MEDAAVSNTAYLRYWLPNTNPDTEEELEAGFEVGSVDEVVATAELVAKKYREAWVDYMPGISLWRTADTPANSLTLGIAPEGWAIIHTNEEFSQVVTRGPGGTGRVLHRVRLGEFLEIPAACFIPRELAIQAISCWFSTGRVLEAAGFSDDLLSL